MSKPKNVLLTLNPKHLQVREKETDGVRWVLTLWSVL